MIWLALACSDSVDDSASFHYDASSNLCGTVTGPAEHPAIEDIGVWTVRAGEEPCTQDTGGGETWWKESVASPEPEGPGGYRFEATIDPGTYGAWVLAADEYQACGAVDVIDEATCSASVELELEPTTTVDKPNLYLYPTRTEQVSVRLPVWRRIVASDPAYPTRGWTVLAHPDGRLSTAVGSRDYLFYELAIDADRLQTDAGWCVAGELAQATIEDAMVDLGFRPNEVGDFQTAWDGEFPDAAEVTVYPQTATLTPLFVDPPPDSLLRVWFLVADGCGARELPVLERVPRFGFHAAEWGVAFLDPLGGPDVVVDGWR